MVFFQDFFSPGQSKHPVFGKVVKGHEVIDAISKVKTRSDNPVTPVMMKSVTVVDSA